MGRERRYLIFQIAVWSLVVLLKVASMVSGPDRPPAHRLDSGFQIAALVLAAAIVGIHWVMLVRLNRSERTDLQRDKSRS